jgi:hypothetical protein
MMKDKESAVMLVLTAMALIATFLLCCYHTYIEPIPLWLVALPMLLFMIGCIIAMVVLIISLVINGIKIERSKKILIILKAWRKSLETIQIWDRLDRMMGYDIFTKEMLEIMCRPCNLYIEALDKLFLTRKMKKKIREAEQAYEVAIQSLPLFQQTEVMDFLNEIREVFNGEYNC